MIERPAAQRDQWLFVGFGVVTFVIILVLVCRPWDLENAFMIGAPVGRDFANFWLGGRLALEGRFALLIDVAGYNELFSRTFAHNPAESFIYSYPPHSLLFVAPFAALPFVPAVCAWTALNLLGIERAVRLLRNDTGLAVAACLSPAALTMVAFGHFGGALAFLAIFAVTRGQERPLAAGICLALVSVKPQLALVLGILMILTGRWRAVAWSVPATLALIAASVAAFGLEPWHNFVAWTVPFHARLVSNFAIEGLRTVISLYALLRQLGVSRWLAQIGHYAFAIVVMARAVQLLNRNGTTPRTVVLGLLAAMAALPYINAYDLAIAAPALTVALFAQRDDAPAFLPGWTAMLLWLAPPFSIPFGLLEIPVVQAIFALTLALALFSDDLLPRTSIGRPAAGRPAVPQSQS